MHKVTSVSQIDKKYIKSAFNGCSRVPKNIYREERCTRQIMIDMKIQVEIYHLRYYINPHTIFLK